MRRLSGAMLCVMSILLAGSQAAGEVVLVKDGQPAATIVVDGLEDQGRRPSGDPWAAEVLAEWIEKITDVRLPISGEPPAEGTAIYVGAAAVRAGLNLDDIDSPSNEGLRILSDGERILLAGQDETSTLKAACRLLEEMGCRFFMSHRLGEVYPRSTSLSVGELSITEKPGMMQRRMWGSSWGGHNAELWRIWNGHGGVTLDKGHAWAGYIRVDEFQEHPEWFGFNGEVRYNNQWLCTSNPELRRVFAQRVIQAIDSGRTHPSLSPPDGRGHCRCDVCTALDDPNSLEVGDAVSKSNRYAAFYRAVAEDVGEVHPDSILNFYAYADYTLPPTAGEKLPENLAAWVAPIAYCWLHGMDNPDCASRQRVADVYDQWSQHVHKFGYRDYAYNYGDCTLPLSKLATFRHDLPYLKERGLIGVDMETLACWTIYGPHMYQFLRLAYDPEADPDALMDDYFLMFYGPEAGPPVQRYWMRIDAEAVRLACDDERGVRSIDALAQIYTPEFLAELQQLLDQAAEAAAGDETLAARVQVVQEGLTNAHQFTEHRGLADAGRHREAFAVYETLIERNEALLEQGLTNKYTIEYLHRFVARDMDVVRLAAIEAPNRVLVELPDHWPSEWDRDGTGLENGFEKADFDHSGWETVATYSERMTSGGDYNATRDWRFRWFRTEFEIPEDHGEIALYFGRLDPQALVYVNGELVNGPDDRPRGQWGVNFTADVGDAVRPGVNVLAIRRPHAWGQLVYEPVLVIEKGADE